MNSNSPTNPGSFAQNNDGNAPEPELFALDLITETALPGQRTLAKNPRTGKEMTLPNEVMNAVSYLDCFKSLHGHVQGFMDGGPDSEERARAIAEIVESVHQGGLTLSARDICLRLAADKVAVTALPPPVVAIITCDRPQALQRLLRSLVSECDFTRIQRCIVVDDSRSPDNQQKNRNITQQTRDLTAFDISYFGATEASQLMATLIRRLPDSEEQIRFLLDRERWVDYFTVGVARNFSLLLSAGEPLVVFDDDTICKAYSSQSAQAGVEFSDRNRQAQFFRAQTDFSKWGAREIADPVQQHMRCLGQTVPAALGVLGVATPAQDSLRHARPKFATTLQRDSRILITECGSLGDPGTVSNNWLATLPLESRRRLLATENQLELAFNERSCWLGVSQPTVRSRALISQVAGFDNREYLPPYFPIERGEDRIFGEITRFIFPRSVCLNYPFAMPHLPIPARQWPSEDTHFSSSTVPTLCLVALAIRQAGPCATVGSSERVEHLADSFRGLASSPPETILSQFRTDWLQHKENYLALLQQTLHDSTPAPARWTDYLHRSIRHAQDSVQAEADLSRLTPSNGAPGGLENIEFWQAATTEFGRSLQAWSDIRREAVALHASRAAAPV